MFGWLHIGNLMLFAQDEPVQEGFLVSLMRSPMFPIMMIGIMLYTMLLLPERRKRSEMQQLVNNLKKNDKVVTIGGIFGVVVTAEDKDEVVIRIDENNNTRIRVRRSAIQGVVESENKKSEA